MKYLYCYQESINHVEQIEIPQEDLATAENGAMDIIRFNNGNFEKAVVSSEEVPEDEDDENNDEMVTEYFIESWETV